MPKKKQRGGRRPGSGRPPLPPGQRLIRLSVAVTPQTLDFLKSSGKSAYQTARQILETASLTENRDNR
jgi:hypothetical protein